jgi:electron transport complex protein RnfG
MNKSLQMILVLGLVGLLSGTSLVAVYTYATPLIEINRRKALEEAIFNVVPGAVKYEAKDKDGEEYFEVYDNKRKLIGYAFMAQGNGYQGNIKIISGIKKDLTTLFGIEILESVETPGLGGEIMNDKFKGQFKNLKFTPEIVCTKKGRSGANEIDAITGATISSQSVASILNAKITRLMKILK